MTNYAHTIHREAWLFTDFGFEYASRIVPEDILNNLPRYVRGPKKGKIKDYKISWEKVEVGGWDSSRDRVEHRVGKVIFARLVYSPWGRQEEVKADFYRDENGEWKRW